MARRIAALGIVLVLACPGQAESYGVLSHEAIVDSVWASSIVPILRARYHPSPAGLEHARAYAYGGCLIQDVGYYPFSSRFYGDLTHYVRTGDFVEALIREAQNVDELAFALGALSHYAADSVGHPVAVNISVPLMYPKIEAKFGDVATYEDDPTAHVRMEFAFDIVQLARGAYLPQAYHDFVGFEVATPVLERAFRDTYGLEIRDVFANFDLSLGTFRWTIGTAIPAMTKAAWQTKRKEIDTLSPGMTEAQFLYVMPRTKYEAEWGRTYRRPTVWQKILAFLLKILPKVGPLKAVAFKAPTPDAERLFVESFRETVDRYRRLLDDVGRRGPAPANRNFDTGRLVAPGDYQLADKTYVELLSRLAKDHFAKMSPALGAHLTAYFERADAEARTPAEAKAWRKVEKNLAALTRARAGSPTAGGRFH